MDYRTDIKRSWLWLIVTMWAGVLLGRTGLVQADQSIDAPTGDYRVNLPLVMMSVQPPARIQNIQALSSNVARYGKFEVAFTISTTADNVYFPYPLTCC